MSERVLVTGGAGYVGGAVVEALSRAGHHVAVLDNLSTGHRQALEGADVALFVGDLADRAAIDAALATFRPTAVVHTAGSILAGESMENPGKYYRNNVVNSLNLLDAMVERGVDRFVFSSSAAVYGNPTRVPIEEDDPAAPVNCYGETKLAIERAAAWYGVAHGLKSIFLRYFNAAGATERLGEAHQPESHLIPIVLEVALGKRDRLYINGTDYPTPDGTAVRDYIHIADLARAHVLAVEAAGKLGGGGSPRHRAYNLGNGSGFSIREVVMAARQVTGHPIPAVDAPRRPGDPAVLVANADRAARELGWTPELPGLEEIIGSAWEWHRKHPGGY
jgi:UDP-glucose 4-epimerase